METIIVINSSWSIFNLKRKIHILYWWFIRWLWESNTSQLKFISRNSNSFHAIQNYHQFTQFLTLFHGTRNLFRVSPNMFPLILYLVSVIYARNNFHHPICSWNLRVFFYMCASETQQISQQLDGRGLLSQIATIEV